MKKVKCLFILIFIVSVFCSLAQSIGVTSPRAGEKICLGKKLRIFWQKSGKMNGRVKVTLFNRQTKVLIARGTANSGRVAWEIPGSVKPGQYRVQVQTMDKKVTGNSAKFSIASCAVIRVTSPKQGEKHCIDGKMRIFWQKSGVMSNRINLILFRRGVNLVIARSAPNSGRFSWRISKQVTPGQYRVRVQTVDKKVVANSGKFPVQNCQGASPSSQPPKGKLEFTTPIKGLCLKKGMGYKIQWKKLGHVPATHVNIHLLKSDCRSLQTVLNKNVPNNGFRRITFPKNVPEGRYCLEVKTTDNATSANSGAFFIRTNCTSGSVDLYIRKIYVDRQCRVKLAVGNNGKQTLPKGTPLGIRVKFFRGNQLYLDKPINDPAAFDIPNGSSVTVPLNLKLKHANTTARVWLNEKNTINESDTKNNSGQATLSCPSTPPPPQSGGGQQSGGSKSQPQSKQQSDGNNQQGNKKSSQPNPGQLSGTGSQSTGITLCKDVQFGGHLWCEPGNKKKKNDHFKYGSNAWYGDEIEIKAWAKNPTYHPTKTFTMVVQLTKADSYEVILTKKRFLSLRPQEKKEFVFYWKINQDVWLDIYCETEGRASTGVQDQMYLQTPCPNLKVALQCSRLEQRIGQNFDFNVIVTNTGYSTSGKFKVTLFCEGKDPVSKIYNGLKIRKEVVMKVSHKYSTKGNRKCYATVEPLDPETKDGTSDCWGRDNKTQPITIRVTLL